MHLIVWNTSRVANINYLHKDNPLIILDIIQLLCYGYMGIELCFNPPGAEDNIFLENLVNIMVANSLMVKKTSIDNEEIGMSLTSVLEARDHKGHMVIQFIDMYNHQTITLGLLIGWESHCIKLLTHLPLVPHICLKESVQDWFR